MCLMKQLWEADSWPIVFHCVFFLFRFAFTALSVCFRVAVTLKHEASANQILSRWFNMVNQNLCSLIHQFYQRSPTTGSNADTNHDWATTVFYRGLDTHCWTSLVHADNNLNQNFQIWTHRSIRPVFSSVLVYLYLWPLKPERRAQEEISRKKERVV